MIPNQPYRISGGQVALGVALALLLGALTPLLTVLEACLLLPVAALGGVFTVFLYCYAGRLPAFLFIAVQLASASTLLGADCMWMLLAAGVCCMLLSTNLIPWSHISKLTGGLVDMLQFPWRILMLTPACLALCGGDGIARMIGEKGMRAAVAALMLGLVCAMPYIGAMPLGDAELEFGQGVKVYMNSPEYQIAGTDVDATRSHAVIIDGDAEMTQYRKDGTRIDAYVEVAEDASLTFPLFGFPGYEAKLNGERMNWRLGENNRLTVDLSAGSLGVLEIHYAGKTIWKVMDILSACAALTLGGWVWHRKKRELA